MSFDSIPSCLDRKTACDNAVAIQSESLSAQEAARQLGMQTHFFNIITRWCSQIEPNAIETAQSVLDLPINQLITSSVLDEWETSLIAKGYFVVRQNFSFRIQLMA